MKVIEFKNIWEMYRIKFIEDGKSVWENVWALKEVNFSIDKGETIGVIGENGSGKSTLLKLIAGMLKPDRGEMQVKGRVSGLLELGAGFEVEMTGKDNIYALAALYGLNKKQIEDKFKAIADFAGIGRFINAPVKNYSSGMFVRLAFALAIHVDPEILLIDDALAVGDEFFQRKCIKKIFELKEEGKTIIFVTHDMNMLQRLCKRVIFLKEGRIVRDGPTQETIPLYTQMVGIRAGVGILETKPLSAIFNNGRLFINWQDKLLTSGSGLYTTFRINDKWYSSPQADWEVEREQNKIVAKGRLYQLDLTQIWKLEVIDNNSLKIDIEIKAQQPFQMQEACTNVMLSNEYNQWFTSLDKDTFPSISEKDKQWHPLLSGNATLRCLGVESNNNPTKGNVSLVFEQAGDKKYAYSQIWNTDYSANCRVLQFREVGLQNYEGDKSNSVSYFSGKIILNIPKLKDYLEKIKDESILSKGDLKIQLMEGQGVISWKGKNLTKASNLSTSLYTQGRWYSSETASWEFNKEEKDRIIAKGTWRNLPLTQIWEIKLNSDSSFTFKVDLEVQKELDILEQYVRIECSESYQYYRSDCGQGEFPDNFSEYYIDVVQRCISKGIVAIESEDKQNPTLAVNFSKDLGNFAKIFNSDISRRARLLSIERVEAEGKRKFSAGSYKCFDIEFSLGESKLIGKKKALKTLIDKNLKFIFEKGRGCIYWQDRELTKKLGFYTSLRSKGRWHDSYSQAVWNIEENSKGFWFKGRWLYLPLRQIWQINLKNSNTIEFEIKMIVEERILIDRLQTNVMLSEGYSDWVTDSKKGEFSSFKGDINDDWEIIWSGLGKEKDKTSFLGVLSNQKKNTFLPTVKIYPLNLDLGWYPNIVNSDLYHRGRVLQYLKKKEENIEPGEYLYFEGKVLIG
ncbi:MAG: ABC transporter ATP-binding protein [Candidatus Omnitrophica bacterium]|jgi:ABC-type polysaccharide/polyol phosphate transport system ATPase subunit|nr:ABC transporter ATP-binding protein [Candidatus Omnitrophota bacterium]